LKEYLEHKRKTLCKTLPASNPIQVSFDLESPHKIFREVFADVLEPQRKTKSEPTSPYQSPITPTSPMPTLDPKNDRLSIYFKGSNTSSEITDFVPAIDKVQKENFRLIRQLEERKTIDTHLHHDNSVLQKIPPMVG
jgi:hypothetical protein